MSFPVYQEYTDSKVEWLGDAPGHWLMSRVKFDSVIKARVGWHGLKSDEFTDEGPYLVTGSDFRGKTINWKNCYHCTHFRYDQDPNIQLLEGDLLITKDGTIGKLMLVTELPEPATLNSGIFVIRPSRGAYKTEFYYWLLQSSVFYDFIAVRQTGSTISHLYQETFGNMPYALPNLEEQTQIARFLDHETAKIDTLIHEQKRLIELLKEKRQAVISHAVTKGLDPDVSMKDSGVEWLGEVPAHWETPKLSWRSNRIGDGLHSTPEYEDNTGYYFVNGNNLVDGSINLSSSAKEVSYEEFVKHQVELGPASVFISINGTIGNVAIYEGEPIILGKSAAYINCDSELHRKFLLHYLKSGKVERYFNLEMTGTTISNLSLRSLRHLKVSLPPMMEQEEIVKYLDAECLRYDNEITVTESLKRLLIERRSALISAAVTGKIDVRNWQPPANESAFEGVTRDEQEATV